MDRATGLIERATQNMMAEHLRANPEVAFNSAVEGLRKSREAYVPRSWIADNGNYWKVRRWDPVEDKGKPRFRPHVVFNPDAYDPKQPYESEGTLWLPERNPTRLLEDAFDLNNLRLMDREKVKEFLDKLESLAYTTPKNQEVVAMIAMGGTIAMKKNRQGTYDPGINAEELLKEVGSKFAEKYAVASIDFPTLIDSSQQEMDYSAEITIAMSWVWKNASDRLKKRLGGFVVAHGTDTMATSSSYTAMMLGPNVPFPVVFIGAQKTPDNDPVSDVRVNLEYGFAALKSMHSQRKNVVGVYAGGSSGGVYSAFGVEKVSDRSAKAFHSPTHPIVWDADYFGEEGIYWNFKSDVVGTESSSNIMSTEFKPVVLRGYSPIIQLRPDMGDDPEAYYEFVRNNTTANSVLLTTFGSFTANNKMRRAIVAAVEGAGEGAKDSVRKKILFGANPFPEGSTEHRYSVAEQLRKSGVVGIQIPPIATKVKVAYAHALLGERLGEIATLVASTNLAGEFPANRLSKLNEAARREGRAEDLIYNGVPKRLLRALYTGKIKDPVVPQKPRVE